MKSKFLFLILCVFGALHLAHADDIPAVGSRITATGKLEYEDYPEKPFGNASPIVIITKQVVNDYQCIPAPGNPPTGNIRVYCDSSTGLFTCLTSTGASCGISPNTTSIPGIYAGASPYSAKFDGRSAQDCSITNNSTTVSSATLSCISADAGKLIFTINTATTLSKLNSTVASCSGTDFVSAVPATATESGDNIVICSDDITPLTNAWNAALAANQPLYLPTGIGCVSSRPFLVPGAPIPINPTVALIGAGQAATTIGMVPSFSFAGVGVGTIFDNQQVSATCGFQASAPHTFPVSTVQDLAVTGFGFNFPNWPIAMPVFGRTCQAHRLGIYNINAAASKFIGISAPQESYVDDANIQGNNNGIGILMTGGGSTAIGNIIAYGTTGGTGYSVVNCTNECAIVGGFTTSLTTGIKLTNSIVSIVDGQISTGSGTTGVTVDATSTANVARMVLVQSGVSTSVGFNVASGGKLRLTQLDNTITSGTPTEIVNAGSVFDACGNNLTGVITNTGSWYGSCSVTGTALISGNVVPSANWGTAAAVSVPTGNSQNFTFTLTNGSASVGANPTLALTFPTPFPVAPTRCSLWQVGGTQAITALTVNLAPSALTATGVTFTYNGTPTVNLTEFYQGSCQI